MVREYARRVREILGSRLVGVYLGGSYGTGELMPGSDYDIAVVITDDLTATDVGRVRALHAQLVRDDPDARRLEGDYLVHETLVPEGTTRPAWWFRDGTVFDPAFMMSADNHANLGRHGVAIDGPAAADVFPAVTADQVRAAVREMLAEAPDDSTERAAARELLGIARSLAALESGEPTSRRAGLAWALANLDDQWRAALLRAADVSNGMDVDERDDTLRRELVALRTSLGF